MRLLIIDAHKVIEQGSENENLHITFVDFFQQKKRSISFRAYAKAAELLAYSIIDFC